LTFALDIFLIVLLVLAIGYGFVLNRRIVALRRDQKSLDKLAASFNSATVRAEASISQLRSTTQDSVRALQQSIVKADAVRGDLEYLLDRGERTADRLEGAVRTGEGAVPGDRGHRAEMSGETDLAGNTDEERELLKALRAVR
jgi:hypothetical protein